MSHHFFLRFVFTLLLISHSPLVVTLRLPTVSIPDYALRGTNTELSCQYELGASTLYAVRWFKDDNEFYRYVPKSTPSYQLFQRDGFIIDEIESEASKVYLRGLQFAASGLYRCEVSTEAPEFKTVIGHGGMLVIDPPRRAPLVTGNALSYTVNDTVDLTCTSAPSHPPAHLTWKINDKQPPDDVVVEVSEPLPQPGGLLIRVTRLRFTASNEFFNDGDLTIKCLASLAPPGYINSPPLSGYYEHPRGEIVKELGNVYRKHYSFSRKVQSPDTATKYFFNIQETSVRVSDAVKLRVWYFSFAAPLLNCFVKLWFV